VRTGNLVFVSGQVPIKDGQFLYQGKVGADISLEEAQQAATLCAINIISQLKDACCGDLDKVRRIVKLGGFVNSTPEFTDQPKVINGASDLMVEVFGDAGKHARAAVSAGSLPLGVAVEIDAVAEVA
jgi:enamine deaminase RidA (YjgF/YER057c/UK114 family)